MESRIIKFRAWNGQKMIIPAAINEYGWYETDRDFEDGRYSTSKFDGVMQFTGLKDGNEKEIYESDIVRFHANYSSKPCGYMDGIVVFENLQWMLKNKNGLYSIHEETDEFFYKSEVIGNLYQNPELSSPLL